MKRKNKYILPLLFAGILLLAASCKTGKETGQIVLAKTSKEERINLLRYQSVPYKTFSSSLHFSFKTGKKGKGISADAQLKIVKDKALQLSARFMGFEVARVNITPSQVTIIDRIHKQYFSESMELLQSYAPFDFDYYSLQSLFTNQLFIAGKQAIAPEDYASFRLTEDDFSVIINNTDSRGINYDFTSDYTHRILKTEMYKNRQDAEMKWSYRDFGLTSDKKLFPMKMDMALTIPRELITLNLSFSSVNIDNEFELETNIPSKYERVHINQLDDLIQSFK
jgi:hypothetical protein